MSVAKPETVFIVLFRGVGGATQLPTKPLRDALAKAGFNKVSTYINSGNAALSSTLDAARTHAKIAELTKRDFGFEKDIFLVSLADWARVIEENPFPEAVEQPTTLHVFTLKTAPSESAVKALHARLDRWEKMVVRETFLYLYIPEGFSASKLPPVIDRVLGTVSTARNWRTVLALGRLAVEKR